MSNIAAQDGRAEESDGLPGLGFVGLGWWGGELAKATERSGAARVVSGFARSEESRASFAAAHGCRTSNSFEEMLEDDDIDGVVLATPHSTHLPMIAAAAEAGKDVFVEKPLTVLYSEAEESVAAAQNGGIVLQVGHFRRMVAATRAIGGLIEGGELGLIHLIEAKMTTPSDLEPRTGWRGDPEECPLGGMTALGVHMVDTIHYLGGPIAEVYAVSHRLLSRGKLDDITTLTMTLESGALATLSTSIVLPREASIAVHGHGGSAWSELDGSELYRQPPEDRQRHQVEIEAVDAIADQMAEFAECIRTRRDPEVTGERGQDVIAVLEAARISSAEGRPIAVADVRSGQLTFG